MNVEVGKASLARSHNVCVLMRNSVRPLRMFEYFICCNNIQRINCAFIAFLFFHEITSNFVTDKNYTCSLYVAKLQCIDNRYYCWQFRKDLQLYRLTDAWTTRMYFIIWCMFALLHNNDAIASSRWIDNVILKFIIDGTPILFPPLRISLHLCTNYGKIFKFVIQMKI